MRGGKTVAEAGARQRKTLGKFTDTKVAKLKAPPKPPLSAGQDNYYQRLDGVDRSLVLSVSYGGSKTWRLYLRDADGKGLTVKLGVWDPGARDHLSVDAALKAAVSYALPVSKQVLDARNFKVVAEEWLAKRINGKKRTEATIRGYLERLVFPLWKDRSILDLKRSDTRALLAGIEARAAQTATATAGGKVMADKVRDVLSSLFKWYAGQDDDFVPPIVAALRRDDREAAEKKRDRVLDLHGAVDGWQEIPALWKATEGPIPYYGMIRFLLLTGQRLEKVRTMKRADIVDGVWRLPTEAREKGNVMMVQLPKLASDVIAAMPTVLNNPYVFPATGRGPVDASSYAKRGLDRALAAALGDAFRPWRLHDLRRTARTLLTGELEVPREIAELVLGHVQKGVEGTYDRGPYFRQKSAALQRLADFVERITAPPVDKVVKYRRPVMFDGVAEAVEVAHG